MSKMLPEEEATGRVAELYAEIRKTMGMVPNFLKAQAAVDPEWLELNWNRFKHIMVEGEGLDGKTRELVALAVSFVNRCEYCTLAHETSARMKGATELEVNQVRQITELFCSFNSIADSMGVEPDITPDMLEK